MTVARQDQDVTSALLPCCPHLRVCVFVQPTGRESNGQNLLSCRWSACRRTLRARRAGCKAVFTLEESSVSGQGKMLTDSVDKIALCLDVWTFPKEPGECCVPSDRVSNWRQGKSAKYEGDAVRRQSYSAEDKLDKFK